MTVGADSARPRLVAEDDRGAECGAECGAVTVHGASMAGVAPGRADRCVSSWSSVTARQICASGRSMSMLSIHLDGAFPSVMCHAWVAVSDAGAIR